MSDSDFRDDEGAEERAFRQLVNMSAEELRSWLDSPSSWSVGWTPDGEEEAVGHRSGRRILELLEAGEMQPRSEEERDFMRRAVGFIRRHLAQRPEGDIVDTRWRYALMNWGHDPLKEESAATMQEEETQGMQEQPEAGEAEQARKPARKGRGTATRSSRGAGTARRGGASRTAAAAAQEEGATTRRGRGTASRSGTKRATSAATKRSS
ncbi:DUF3140 domain-containing protein, partial [Crenalkalicoccus roseus]|uniref:DUF3140 domain-containing protein n=1 Tax=Crenalkalicoccus roseus TaxID=1485588 RepID=UPI0018652563